MVDEFADTKVPSNGGHVAWLAALTPNELIDVKILLRLARADADVNANDGGDLATLRLGAILYRNERFEEAARVLTDLAAKFERTGDRSAYGDLGSALYFLAMVRHQLAHPFQARRYLASAAKIVEEGSADLSWWIQVQLDVLDSEARA